MDIDFHYGVIYTVCRLAGMDRPDAQSVAYACQHVDDVLSIDPLDDGRWSGRADALSNQHRLSALHFIPGCEGRRPEEKMVCRANSGPALAVVRDAIAQRSNGYGLQRL